MSGSQESFELVASLFSAGTVGLNVAVKSSGILSWKHLWNVVLTFIFQRWNTRSDLCFQ